MNTKKYLLTCGLFVSAALVNPLCSIAAEAPSEAASIERTYPLSKSAALEAIGAALRRQGITATTTDVATGVVNSTVPGGFGRFTMIDVIAEPRGENTTRIHVERFKKSNAFAQRHAEPDPAADKAFFETLDAVVKERSQP